MNGSLFMADSDPDLIDRPRGILTRKERKHLIGLLDEDLDANADAIRQREYRIRQHIRHSIIDAVIIAGAYDYNIDQVFTDLDRVVYDADMINDSTNLGPKRGRSPDQADQSLADGVEELFDLLYLALGSTDTSAVSSFRLLLKQGVSSALVNLYAWYGLSVIPSVALRIELGDIVPLNSIKTAHEDGEPISNQEAKALLHANRISYDELVEVRRDNQQLLKKGAEAVTKVGERKSKRREAVALDDAEIEDRLDRHMGAVMLEARARGRK
jgi:hypothetical protein